MKSLFVLFCVMVGVFTTYFLIDSLNLNPVFASSLIGLIGSSAYLLQNKLKNYAAVSIYCGSFIGMGSILTPIQLFFAGLLATFLLIGFNDIFKGYGGKLGFMAYLSSITIGFITVVSKKAFVVPSLQTFLAPISGFNEIIVICLAVILGFLSTIYLHHTRKTSAVFASAFPSFFASLMVFTNLPNINLFVATFYSVTFAGMLAEDLLPPKIYPILMFLLILTTVLFKNGLGGFGGSLGTIAFVSVFVLSIFTNRKVLNS